MNAETFCEHFATFADAPNGIAKLRTLVLELALRGRLLPQDENDGPAINGLTEIDDEKQSLIATRNLRPNRVSEIEQTRVMQYPVPPSWRWFRLSEVAFFQEGPGIRNWQFRSEGVKLLNVQNIVDNKLVLDNSDRYISTDEFESTYTHFAVEAGDILLASSGGSWGKTAWFEDPGYPVMLNTSMIRLKFFSKRFSDDFLRLFLRSKHFRMQMETQLVGMQPNFGSTHLGRVYIPIPPLAEQWRIVEKVDQLLGLCDELAARQAAQREKRQRLVGATLDRLVSPQTSRHLACRGGLTASAPLDSDTTGAKANEPPGQARWRVMQDDAHRLRNHFDQLFDTPTTIPQLRQTILQLAVQGQLVPQDPKERPVEGLCTHDAELAAARSFEVPLGWALTRLANLAEINGGFAFKSTEYTEEGTRVVRISDFDEFGFKDHKVVRHPFSPDLQKFVLEQNNILMAMTGGTVGKSYWVKTLPEQMVVNQRVATIKVLDSAIPSYIDIVIRSEMTQEVIRKAKNSTNDNISMGDIKGFAIPVPPLAEQKRIVTKVTELLSLCDALEAKLTQAQSASTQLLSAAVHHLLNESSCEGAKTRSEQP